MATVDQLITQARTWIGVKFRHQGRTRRGIDCAGLVIKVAHELQLTDFDISGYERNAAGFDFVQHFRANMDEIHRPADMRAGDALVFPDSTYPCHCAFLSSKDGVRHIIHAHAPKRVVWEDPYAFEWPGKLRFIFRFPGLEA